MSLFNHRSWQLRDGRATSIFQIKDPCASQTNKANEEAHANLFSFTRLGRSKYSIVGARLRYYNGH